MLSSPTQALTVRSKCLRQTRSARSTSAPTASAHSTAASTTSVVSTPADPVAIPVATIAVANTAGQAVRDGGGHTGNRVAENKERSDNNDNDQRQDDCVFSCRGSAVLSVESPNAFAYRDSQNQSPSRQQ